MTITVKAAREALEAAHLAYVSADIEHPIATLVAKEALTNARHEYWDACARLCVKLEFTGDIEEVSKELYKQGVWS